MLALIIAITLITNFRCARETFRGADRPVESIWRCVAGARGFRNTVLLFECEYLGRHVYRGYSQELRGILNAAGYDVHHLGDGLHVVDSTSAADKLMKSELHRFGKFWFGARLTPEQLRRVGIGTMHLTTLLTPSAW